MDKSTEARARLRFSVFRYEKYWLPLLADSLTTTNDDPDIEPPSDVGWVWHLHLLRPQHYRDHCSRRYARPALPHRVRPARGPETGAAIDRAKAAWSRRYPGVPFDRPGTPTVGLEPDSRLADLLLDVVGTTEAEFAYAAVDGPHFADPNFIYAGVERYRKWLLLRQARPEDAAAMSRLQLPVDIELVGRAHALHPVQFGTDMTRLFPAVSNPLLNCVTVVSAGSCPTSGPEADVVRPGDVERANGVWRSAYRGEKLFISGTGRRGRLGVRSPAIPLADFRSAGTTNGPQAVLNSSAFESCDLVFTSLVIDELAWSSSSSSSARFVEI